MFKGACRLDDLAHRNIIFIRPFKVKKFNFARLRLRTNPPTNATGLHWRIECNLAFSGGKA